MNTKIAPEIGDPDYIYGCSFCPAPAKYVGEGRDGDFYCEDHRRRAPGGLLPVND